MTADYTLGFVQRDGNMHDHTHFGANIGQAIKSLEVFRDAARKDRQSGIHWYVYDANDPERGYFDSAED